MNKPAEYIEDLHNLPVYAIPQYNIRLLVINLNDIFSLLYDNLCTYQTLKYAFNIGAFLERYSSVPIETFYYNKFEIINALNNLYDNGISYYEVIKSTKIKDNGHIIKKFIEENKDLGEDNE